MLAQKAVGVEVTINKIIGFTMRSLGLSRQALFHLRAIGLVSFLFVTYPLKKTYSWLVEHRLLFRGMI